jgi:diadenosine tetraphosphatase ApaH/serine/threonine PP2A family protein phosphatase
VAYLILSDVHANREALDAVLEDSRAAAPPEGYAATLCLGDVVGYGADPAYTIEWARTSPKVVIRGNHDKLCCGLDALELYNTSAQASAIWTTQILKPAETEFLRALPRGPLPFDDFDLVHGSPRDEDEYLIQSSHVDEVRGFVDTQLTFFGHTHVQGGFLLTHAGTRPIPPDRTLNLEPDHFYLVNPGSVGQPRDRDPRAAYAIYYPEDRRVEFRRVAYDIESAARKILDAGLPPNLAARLSEGK